ncbi:uncharacterized protein LOC132281624 [Cornus florida]|uniref:uncharacterized protein LOC132281624 n=1 Tax=Cornus florida TaxID=4283 RepID=UPI0028977A56|nr:uncharacterized protein LOC132281624 [Cornus florida]
MWSHVTLPTSEGGFNIRRVNDINAATKISICWDFVQKKYKLWIKWLHAVYLQRVSFWNVVHKGDDSAIWKQLIGVRQLLLDNIELKIGDGMDFNLLTDPWCEQQTLIQKVGAALLRQVDINLKVADIIQNGNWAIPDFLLEEAVIDILRVEINSGKDVIV